MVTCDPSALARAGVQQQDGSRLEPEDVLDVRAIQEVADDVSQSLGAGTGVGSGVGSGLGTTGCASKVTSTR